MRGDQFNALRSYAIELDLNVKLLLWSRMDKENLCSPRGSSGRRKTSCGGPTSLWLHLFCLVAIALTIWFFEVSDF